MRFNVQRIIIAKVFYAFLIQVRHPLKIRQLIQTSIMMEFLIIKTLMLMVTVHLIQAMLMRIMTAFRTLVI